MNILRTVFYAITLSAIGFGVGNSGGCAKSPADCPASATIKPGAACSDDDLQCNYDVPRVACDGTKSTIPGSCICSGGTWDCPQDWTCEAGPPDDAGDDGASDDAAETADDASTDAPPVDSGAEVDAGDAHD